MRIDRIYASAAAEEHMRAKHGVTWPEAEQALRDADSIRRVQRVRGQRRYMAKGRTHAGRRLTVVFVREPDDGLRVITAFDQRR